MNSMNELETAADDEDSAATHISNDQDELYDSSGPSTAASSTETIGSTEEIHLYDEEWESFSDATSDGNASDVGESTGSDCGDSDAQSSRSDKSTIESVRSSQDIEQAQAPLSPEVSPMDRHRSSRLSTPAGSESISQRTPLLLSDDGRQSNNSLRRRIQVMVRVRPLLGSEGKVVVTCGENEGTSLCAQATNTQGSVTVTECTFDRVFMGTSTQEDVFAAVELSVQGCLDGYNATVFAYGQTGTGKTHTLFGNDLGVGYDDSTFEFGTINSSRAVKASWGIVPRALSYLLDKIDPLKAKGVEVDLQLSFLQIYNDRLFDLLTDRMRQKPLLIREQPALDGTTTVSVQGLSHEKIASFSTAMRLIYQGHTNRCVRETEANMASSRSHAIVQLHVETRSPRNDEACPVVRKARLNLVDLAGSEKWNTDVEMEDARSQELKNINTSLSALGNCIAALTEAGRKHIPYRDSTLTRVLQDSFGGNTQACLIATVNATQQSSDETLRTLQFADRARSVMQTIRVNEVADGSSELVLAKVQIAKLRERLESEQRRRHETRLKELQSLQRDFQEKLKGKEKEIRKLSRDNCVFQRWREEDVKKIRSLESRIKDLESNNCRNDDGHSQATAVVQLQSPISPSVAGSNGITLAKSESRANLKRTRHVDASAPRSYTQVLERYAVPPSNETVLTDKAVVVERKEGRGTNQYDGTSTVYQQVPSAKTQEYQRRSWADKPEIQAPENEDGKKGIITDSSLAPEPKSAWSYASFSGYTSEWANSLLSKATPAIIPQKQINPESGSMFKSPSSVVTTTLPHKPELLKSVSVGALNSSAPLQSPSTMLSNGKERRRAVAACQRHRLAGCMLCTVTMGNLRQNPAISNETTAASNLKPVLNSEAVRKVQDGPCERHQLLRCFICMKGSVNSSASFPIVVAAPPILVHATPSPLRVNEGGFPPLNGVTSKCALHALDNCILCAGAKAMTRKVAPPVEASPSKSTYTFSPEHLADRQRRYTLDERILNYQTRL